MSPRSLGRVDVHFRNAPLFEAPTRLSTRTGMNRVREGGPPRQPPTAAFKRLNPADAILKIPEGKGLTYALQRGG